MALITCPECKKEISDSANSCPHCGYVINENKSKPKKKKGCFTWVLVIIVLLLAFIYYYGKNSGSSSTDSYSTTSINVSVENVRISKDHSNAWAVKGSIRNNTTRSIKGAVKIKFINSTGDIVHSNRAYVNGGDSFSSGQAANFEYFTEPEKFNDVVDFKVEFYER